MVQRNPFCQPYIRICGQRVESVAYITIMFLQVRRVTFNEVNPLMNMYRRPLKPPVYMSSVYHNSPPLWAGRSVIQGFTSAVTAVHAMMKITVRSLATVKRRYHGNKRYNGNRVVVVLVLQRVFTKVSTFPAVGPKGLLQATGFRPELAGSTLLAVTGSIASTSS